MRSTTDEQRCLRCDVPLATANVSSGGFSFAGQPVRLLVCRRCGHVEIVAVEPTGF